MLETYGFSLRTQSYQPYQRMDRHRHPEAYICLVTDGGFIDNHLRGGEAADAGSVLVRPGGDEHKTACGSEGANCVKLELKVGWLSKGDSDALFRDRLTLSSPDFLLLSRRIHRLMQAHDALPDALTLSSRLELESSVMDLLAHLVRPRGLPADGAPAQWLQKVHRAIVDEPFRQWTASALAAKVNRHPVHVSRVFREHYGEPLGSFFRRQRLERCRELLADGEVALVDVAMAAGYADQSHFTRAYKQAFGVTPGRERELINSQ
ncbi:MAG TPA: helix-turn-helix transcriptional regulator [Gammaproteobacteria bacterium]|nr:helix-turn-helix transcriptional regulator [Gammaproteobacteria bacterium]